MDALLVPVHQGGAHWILLVAVVRDRAVAVFDSLGSRARPQAEARPCSQSAALCPPRIHPPSQALLQYLSHAHRDRTGGPLDASNWQITVPCFHPLQTNSSDCGLFMLRAAHCFCVGAPWAFDQSDMDAYRLALAKMLLVVDGALPAPPVRWTLAQPPAQPATQAGGALPAGAEELSAGARWAASWDPRHLGHVLRGHSAAKGGFRVYHDALAAVAEAWRASVSLRIEKGL